MSFSCAQNDSVPDDNVDNDNDTVNTLTADNDGDGVTNQQETVDNTDPEDPCSVNLNSQYGPAVTDEWKALDCDGDGVTNQQELEDQTGFLDPNGYDLCDYVEAHQDITIITDLWKSYDCDGDAVPNGIELLTDNTDINDSCNLIISSQIPGNISDHWRNLDCDEDGVNNGDELNDGTDPLDPDSYLGAGTKLQYFDFWGRKYTFLNDGALFDKMENENNELRIDYEYDSQNRLTHVFRYSSSSIGHYDIYFSYNGNNISEINYTRGTQSTIYTITYEGLKIHMDEPGQNVPNGFHGRTFTFDSNGKVLYSEAYNGNLYYRTDFTYDSNGDLTSTLLESKLYDPATQTYSSTDGTSNYLRESFNYSYDVNVVNPVFNAGQVIYTQAILVSDILGFSWSMRYSSFSEHFATSASRWSETFAGSTSNSETYGVNFVQPNQYPRFAYMERWGTEYPVDFFYSE